MIQQMVIEQFKSKYKNPTYKDWVKLTGIEQTRIFRIRNGSPIKIDELEKLLQALGDDGLSLKLFFDCFVYLGEQDLADIEREMRRKIMIAKLSGVKK